jgi:hypothetical protein
MFICFNQIPIIYKRFLLSKGIILKASLIHYSLFECIEYYNRSTFSDRKGKELDFVDDDQEIDKGPHFSILHFK